MEEKSIKNTFDTLSREELIKLFIEEFFDFILEIVLNYTFDELSIGEIMKLFIENFFNFSIQILIDYVTSKVLKYSKKYCTKILKFFF